MTTTIFNGKIKCHPSGVVEAYGTNEKGREFSIYFPGEEILKIVEFLKFTDSLGHAQWHAQNPDCSAPCSSCKKEG